ncbi:hypothetical protein CCACVL1_12709 [Corchorus capsularis]|uniref:Uncharacterized protein n=1 Tax=Corchorus capsularis TaxID=210143 RepID=A0A1R3IE74_COCAP|nr:hypothetical protein CCACVL1_12709 [Corchorus capsularis]
MAARGDAKEAVAREREGRQAMVERMVAEKQVGGGFWRRSPRVAAGGEGFGQRLGVFKRRYKIRRHLKKRHAKRRLIGRREI